MVSGNKSHKAHPHKVQRVPAASGIEGSKKLLTRTQYASNAGTPASPPSGAVGGQSTKGATAPSGGVISQAGQKALQFRAKKILAPLADPSQSITE